MCVVKNTVFSVLHFSCTFMDYLFPLAILTDIWQLHFRFPKCSKKTCLFCTAPYFYHVSSVGKFLCLKSMFCSTPVIGQIRITYCLSSHQLFLYKFSILLLVFLFFFCSSVVIIPNTLLGCLRSFIHWKHTHATAALCSPTPL